MSDAPARPPKPEKGFVRHAVTVSGLTMVSRVTGLVRDAALAATMGLGAVADAFFLAFLIPNLFRRLFGEGALAAALVAIYTELRASDPKAARQLASAILILLAVALGAITLACEAALFGLLSMGFGADTSLAIRLAMVMLPYMPLVCAVAVVGGIMQVHDRFAVPAFAPVLLNGCIIAAAAVVGFGGGDAKRVAWWVSLAVVGAGVAQLALMLAVLPRVEPITLALRDIGVQVRRVLWLMLPMAVGLAVFQVNTLLDGLLAFFLSPKAGGPEQLNLFGWAVDHPVRAGSVAALQWSQRLYQFPLGVFGIAIATAIFPALARAAANMIGDDKPEAIRTDAADQYLKTIRQGVRLTIFIALPASVGLIVVRLPLARLIYEHGRFSLDDAQRVAMILTGYAAAVWAYATTHVLTKAYHARQDARTPLRVTLAMVACNLCLNAVLIWPLGAVGLAWSTAITAALQCALLTRLLTRHTGEAVVDGTVLAGWGRSLVLAVVMGGALLPITLLWPSETLSKPQSAGLLGVMVVLGAAVYGGGALLSRAPELAWLRGREM